MKFIRSIVLLFGTGLLLFLNPLHAQPNLSALSANSAPISSDQLPQSGTFWLATCPNGQLLPPFPCVPPTLSGAPVYDLGGGQFLVDNSGVAAAAPRRARGMAQAAAFGLTTPDDAGSGDSGSGTNSYVPYVIPTNGLWLQITNIANGLAYANLNNATDSVYEIFSKTDLTATNWTIEQEVWPTNGTVMPFVVSESGRTNLFLWARDWTGVTENGNTTPDWWFFEYYGTTALSDTNLDSKGVNTLLYDYQNSIDPNIISFTTTVTNNYVGSAGAWVLLNILQGKPNYVAVMVDDPNYAADANWQPYTGPNINVNLGQTQGWHDVWIGLEGSPASALPIWQWNRFKLDLTPPQIVITGPSNVVSQPLIQLTGYSPEALSQISCDISNALGVLTNQQVVMLDRFYDTNTWEFTTNAFQAFDMGLTNGLNTFTFHATDLAGNASATNFSVTLVSDTNAPVVSLNWPQNGMQLCGNSFTVSGTLDDPSAMITAMLVDTNGNTNCFNGLIERNGNFWFDNLPLTGGSNWVTLTAVDVWGNTTITNLVVSQSAMTLTIAWVDPTQLYLPTINLSGTIGDPAATIWVNGTQATNYGNGTWAATNVPVNAGGTASFYVSAYPATDSLSTNANNADASPFDTNPSAPAAYSAAADVIKASRIYVESYETSGTSTAANDYDDADGSFSHSFVSNTINWGWREGGDSGGTTTETTIDAGMTIWDGQGNGIPVTNTCNAAQNWAPSFYPNVVLGPDSYACGFIGLGVPSIVWQSQNFPTKQGYGYLSGTPSSGFNRSGHYFTSQSHAQAKIKLCTGGRAYVGQQNLWAGSAWAAENRLVYDTEFSKNSWSEGYTFQQYYATSTGIAMGTFGQLGGNGWAYTMLPNDTSKDITPTANGMNNYTFGVNALQCPLNIVANGTTLDPDVVVSNATFCVGQQVGLNAVWAFPPPGVTQMSYQWGAMPSFVNRVIPATGDGSSTPTNDPAMMTNNPVNLWWYDEGKKQVWVNVTNSTSDGRTFVSYGYGWVSMFRPQMTSFHSSPPFTPVIADGYLELGTDGGQGIMAFAVNVKSTNFPGVVNWTQLINRNTTANVTSTGGQFWLDNDQLYNGPVGGPPVNTPAKPNGTLRFQDNPGVSSSIFGVSCTDSFKTYVVFLPDPAFSNCTNIWVTLGVVNWGWSGTESLGGSLSSSNVVAPWYANSYDFPQYPHTIHIKN